MPLIIDEMMELAFVLLELAKASPQELQVGQAQSAPHLQEALPTPVVTTLLGHVHGLQPQCSPHEHLLCPAPSPPVAFIELHLYALSSRMLC
jgi:hypothetical protein